ncbi:Nif3-like dinuclear metal center hexameric protein, partial [archaeon]|nr:Nif3-like dinuclear metal center hexameric protein [archaeon]
MTNRDQIIFFINNFLNISSYKDNSSNGLQIIGKNDVKKIALGVSYSLEFLEKSIELNCDIMIVHHGLFWGKIDRIDNS